MKSASSSQDIPIKNKVSEAWNQFMRLLNQRAPWNEPTFDDLEDDYNEYSATCEAFGFTIEGSKSFEIGCGQRPYRLFYLLASGVDASAVDLDRVFICPSFEDIFATLIDNGAERAFKTVARYILFDRFENRKFKEFLSNRARTEFTWPLDRIYRGSASRSESWPPRHFNFIYSEDVFEHIPKEELPLVCDQMAEHLQPNGVAFVRPMIFTGIQGGHHVEWYDVENLLEPKLSLPWDHLRNHQHPANTYLNQVSLAEYRKIFSTRFEIIEERISHPGLGHELLTPKIRKELSQYSDEELFSNRVAFVLITRKKR